MRTAQTVLTVIQERGKQHKPIERVYKLLFNRDFYLNAYAKLYPNNGAMTKGVTDETVVLLSHKKADSYIHIDVEFGEGEGKIPVDSIAKRAEAYKPKEKVTYKMIKEYIEAKYGFRYIPHISQR